MYGLILYNLEVESKRTSQEFRVVCRSPKPPKQYLVGTAAKHVMFFEAPKHVQFVSTSRVIWSLDYTVVLQYNILGVQVFDIQTWPILILGQILEQCWTSPVLEPKPERIHIDLVRTSSSYPKWPLLSTASLKPLLLPKKTIKYSNRLFATKNVDWCGLWTVQVAHPPAFDFFARMAMQEVRLFIHSGRKPRWDPLDAVSSEIPTSRSTRKTQKIDKIIQQNDVNPCISKFLLQIPRVHTKKNDQDTPDIPSCSVMGGKADGLACHSARAAACCPELR